MTNNQLIANRDAASARVHDIDKALILLGESEVTPKFLPSVLANLNQAWRDAEARAIMAQRKLEREWNYS